MDRRDTATAVAATPATADVDDVDEATERVRHRDNESEGESEKSDSSEAGEELDERREEELFQDDPTSGTGVRWDFESMTGEALDRMEAMRRSAIPRAFVKKVMSGILGYTPSPGLLIVMSGITKIFVAEVMEQACKLAKERGEQGPLRPWHLRQAMRLLRRQGVMPQRHAPRLLMRR